MAAAPASVTAVDDSTVRRIAVGAVFSDFGGGRINCIDFHRKDDLARMIPLRHCECQSPSGISQCLIIVAFVIAGHKQRVVSLCMSSVNDSFMSGSLDYGIRMWDLRVNACQVATWTSYIGIASCLMWAPRKLMFVAASSVLTFWIPNYESADAAVLPPDNLNPVL